MSEGRVVRVQQPTRVIRSNGVPAIVRVPVTQTRVVRTGVPGPVGPAGAPGMGTSGGLTYSQPVPALVWTIAHNFGYWPDVATYTPGGLTVEGTVLNLSLNVLTITFLTPQAGTARLS